MIVGFFIIDSDRCAKPLRLAVEIDVDEALDVRADATLERLARDPNRIAVDRLLRVRPAPALFDVLQIQRVEIHVVRGQNHAW